MIERIKITWYRKNKFCKNFKSFRIWFRMQISLQLCRLIWIYLLFVNNSSKDDNIKLIHCDRSASRASCCWWTGPFYCSFENDDRFTWIFCLFLLWMNKKKNTTETVSQRLFQAKYYLVEAEIFYSMHVARSIYSLFYRNRENGNFVAGLDTVLFENE